MREGFAGPVAMSGFDGFYPTADRLASVRFPSIRDMRKRVRLSADFLFDMLTASWLDKSTFREEAMGNRVDSRLNVHWGNDAAAPRHSRTAMRRRDFLLSATAAL